MSEGQQGASGDAQQAANEVVNSAQRVANSVVDVAEEAAASVLGALLEANRLIGEALQSLTDKVVGR